MDPDELGRETINRVMWRLVPLLFMSYVVAYLDRVNIGFAATELQRDLGLTDAAYGLGAGLFFVTYCLFEIPSNLILARVGARAWIARILITWGLVSIGMMLVGGRSSFYAFRLLLGVAEAGFFPGIILYLTYWIPSAARARAGALFLTAGPVSFVIGAPVSQLLLKLDGRLGLHGWQWLFLVEGFPAILLGLIAWRWLTDRPEHATWLDDRQRAWLIGQLQREHADQQAERLTSAEGLRSVLSGRIWLLSGIYFLNALANYGLLLWLPKILREASPLRGTTLGAVTAIPFVVSLGVMVLVGRHSDRTAERKWHAVACVLTASVGLALASRSQASFGLIVTGFTLSVLGEQSVLSVFWAMPPLLLGGTAAAAGIAMINSLGNLGGAVGPWVVGTLRTHSGGYASGLLVLAAVFVLEATLIALLRLPRARRVA
jgi:ACS family tartrate transporter-like MFS transporter